VWGEQSRAYHEAKVSWNLCGYGQSKTVIGFNSNYSAALTKILEYLKNMEPVSADGPNAKVNVVMVTDGAPQVTEGDLNLARAIVDQVPDKVDFKAFVVLLSTKGEDELKMNPLVKVLNGDALSFADEIKSHKFLHSNLDSDPSSLFAAIDAATSIVISGEEEAAAKHQAAVRHQENIQMMVAMRQNVVREANQARLLELAEMQTAADADFDDIKMRQRKLQDELVKKNTEDIDAMRQDISKLEKQQQECRKEAGDLEEQIKNQQHDLELQKRQFNDLEVLFEGEDLADFKKNMAQFQDTFGGFDTARLEKHLEHFQNHLKDSRVQLRQAMNSFRAVAEPIGLMILNLQQTKDVKLDENVGYQKVLANLTQSGGMELTDSLREDSIRITLKYCPGVPKEAAEHFVDAIPLKDLCFSTTNMKPDKLAEIEEKMHDKLMEVCIASDAETHDLNLAVEAQQKEVKAGKQGVVKLEKEIDGAEKDEKKSLNADLKEANRNLKDLEREVSASKAALAKEVRKRFKFEGQILTTMFRQMLDNYRNVENVLGLSEARFNLGMMLVHFNSDVNVFITDVAQVRVAYSTAAPTAALTD